MTQDSPPDKKLPLLLKQAIEAFQNANMFDAFSHYSALSHSKEKCAFAEEIKPHQAQLLLCFCHFFDAIIFSFRIHDVYMTAEALTSVITVDNESESLPSWIDSEGCLKQVANLVQFCSLASMLHKEPEATPIEVLRNHWHDNVRKLALKKKHLFSDSDHIPLFSIVNFSQPSSPAKLPILSDFVSGWVVPITYEVLPYIEVFTEHCKDAATCWVFDSISTLCYALSSESFSRCILHSQTSNSHELFIAGRDCDPHQSLFESFSHIQKWQLLPTWQLSCKDESKTKQALEKILPCEEGDLFVLEGALGDNLQQFIQRLYSERIKEADPTYTTLRNSWRLISTAMQRTMERQQIVSRIVNAAASFYDRTTLEINTILALWIGYYHSDRASTQRISYSFHPLAGSVQNECLQLLATHLHKKNPLSPTEKVEKKKLPRVVYIVSHLADQKHPPSNLLRLFAQYYNKDLFDVALLTTEVDSLNPTLYPCQQRVALHSLDSASSTLALLKKHYIAYKVEDAAVGHYERVLSTLNSLKKIDPDIVVFQEASPLHQLLSYYIQIDPSFNASTVLFESSDFSARKGFDHWISALEDLPKHSYGSMQVHPLPLHIDSRKQWKRQFPQKTSLGLPETARIATTTSNSLYSRLTPSFCQAVSSILQQTPDLYYVPIGHFTPKDESHVSLKDLFDPSIRDRVIPADHLDDPSDWMRCMDLYLNEFPIGGYMGIIDAMASGLPVVTQYDPKGPVQSRYGGYFAGIENSCKTQEEYINRAITLLNDPMKYYIASQRSYQEYETRSSPELYLNRLQRLFASMLEERSSRH